MGFTLEITRNGHTLKYFYKKKADSDPDSSSDFIVAFDGTVGADALKKVSFSDIFNNNLEDTSSTQIVILDASDADTTQNAGEREWKWDVGSDLTSDQQTFFHSLFDGSGQICLGILDSP